MQKMLSSKGFILITKVQDYFKLNNLKLNRIKHFFLPHISNYYRVIRV